MLDWLSVRGLAADGLDRYGMLYGSGRAALYWGVRGLGVGRDVVVKVPAYHCGVEVDAILAAGARVEFYRIRPDLSIDVEHLEQLLRERPGPVLVIHYFGFVGPEIDQVDRLCRDRRVPWIEDCAHALFSSPGGRDVGSLAPLAVFSLRKSLALWDGGGLRVNRRGLDALGVAFAPSPRGDCPWPVYGSYARHGIRRAAGRRGHSLYARLMRAHPPRAVDEDGAERWTRYHCRMSAMSSRTAASVDAAAVVATRRSHWQRLHAALRDTPGYGAVFDTLPEGTSPWCLPLRLPQGRDEALTAFRARGIGAFPWGHRPHPQLDLSRHPDACRLASEIVCLPVYQQLTAEDVVRMGHAARDVLMLTCTGRRRYA